MHPAFEEYASEPCFNYCTLLTVSTRLLALDRLPIMGAIYG